MSKYLTAIVALAVSFFALTQGFGQTSTASAAGVTTVTINKVGCSSAGIDVTLGWATLNKGPQYVYWSLQNNGFQAGTYSASAALPADATSAMVSGLPSSSAIYVMVGTVIGGTLEPGQTMVFSTTGICDGASYGTMPQYGPGMYPNFMQQACNLFHEGWQGQQSFYGPMPYGMPYGFHDDFGYWDDEDEGDDDEDFWDDESDEDESDEGDEDDMDESDEDEDDEGDGPDEDDEDDEHDDHGYQQYPGILSYCLPQFGHQANYSGWGY